MLKCECCGSKIKEYVYVALDEDKNVVAVYTYDPGECLDPDNWRTIEESELIRPKEEG